MNVYPYKFKPIYKEKIWGGSALERLFGRELPAGDKIGESWELADLPEGESVIVNGSEAGRGIHWLVKQNAADILGEGVALDDGRFPLLLKYLDANDILSLQVHPDAESAKELGPPAKFKTECWYVLESRGGYIYKGLKPGITEQDFREVVLQRDDNPEAIQAMLQRYDVKAGDFHYLPAGTLHALGPGVVVAEIQTPSYTTYRVSDWGRGRETHLSEALRCIHFTYPPDQPPGAQGDVLVKTEYFIVRKVVYPTGKQELPACKCRAWMTLSGKGEITTRNNLPPVPINPGDTLLIPAAVGEASLSIEEQMMVLEITVPPRQSIDQASAIYDR